MGKYGPWGITAVGVFLCFGAIVALLAGITLIWRGTFLDKMWALNPPAYRQIEPLGPIVGILFLLLSTTLALAAAGWIKRRRWGWRLVGGIISAQAVGDLVNSVRGDPVRGGIGFAIAVVLLCYLLRAEVRCVFMGAGTQGSS